MSPYFLIATTVMLLGIALWFRLYEGGQGEPALWFSIWLLLGSSSALCAALAWWIGDSAVSLSFFAATHVLLAANVFVLFLFARCFSYKASYTIFFWSIPMQFAVSLVIVNRGDIFTQSGNTWVFNTESALAITDFVILSFYSFLVLVYLWLLIRTLRREEKPEEARRINIITVAIIILFVTNIVGDVVNAVLGYAISIQDIGNVIGALVLLAAFRSPLVGKTREI